MLEKGVWDLGNGYVIEAGDLNTNQLAPSWEIQNLSDNFTDPLVISQVQTDNDPDLVTTRQNTINPNSFEIALQEEENSDGTHGNETIGYIALDPILGGTWNGNKIYAYASESTANHNFTASNINYSSAGFNSPPQFFGLVASYNGSDPAWLRYRNLGTSRVQVKVDEDAFDNEKRHVSENIDFLAIEGSGYLTGTEI